MKYQALKKLKTKNKLIKICDTLQEAHDIITKQEQAKFFEHSYYGGFPIYVKQVKDKEGSIYSIQGLAEGINVMCSLNDKEKLAFNFNA